MCTTALKWPCRNGRSFSDHGFRYVPLIVAIDARNARWGANAVAPGRAGVLEKRD
jgi:hypothetical protein